MAEPESLLARVLGQAAYQFAAVQPMIPTYVHLLASALFPIYAGAHASLSRPSSAAKPTKRRNIDQDADNGSEEENEEEEETHKMEGLSPTDAIMMPLLAGITLAGLYFLIKWLEDPKLLNKILNGYFAVFAVFSVARLLSDTLDFGHGLLFPRRYALGGALYHVDAKKRNAIPVAGNINNKHPISSPFPGFLARLPLSDGFRDLSWSDRAMPANKWTLRVYLHRVFAGKFRVGMHGIFGILIAIAAVAYFNFVDKPWYLTNLMGFGFAYGALQLMSPTTFATGSLILGALFFYDIYFVFYTPMMVTVAKTLDVPIKLVFPRPPPPDSKLTDPSIAMLGLGDVVLPGLMIGLALRFDLFLFYLRRQKCTPTAREGKHATVQETVVKPHYFSLKGRWSDHFWTHSLTGRPLYSISQGSKPEPPFTFPKTYFTASLGGYILGMLTTLGVMHMWGHAQPALLYLVPGVLGSLWLTALLRGELKLVWDFSEAVDEETEEESSEEQSKGQKDQHAPERTSFFSLSEKKSVEREARMGGAIRKHITIDAEPKDKEDREEGDENNKNKMDEVTRHRTDREIFSFSIEAPWTLKHSRSMAKPLDEGDDQKPEKEEQSTLEKGKPNWAPLALAGEVKDAEPAGKRIRLN